MAKHTPGPWKADFDQIWGNTDKLHVEVAMINYRIGKHAAEANAHLIADAPIMLSVLNEIADLAYSDNEDDHYSDSFNPAFADTLSLVLKHRGEN